MGDRSSSAKRAQLRDKLKRQRAPEAEPEPHEKSTLLASLPTAIKEHILNTITTPKSARDQASAVLAASAASLLPGVDKPVYDACVELVLGTMDGFMDDWVPQSMPGFMRGDPLHQANWHTFCVIERFRQWQAETSRLARCYTCHTPLSEALRQKYKNVATMSDDERTYYDLAGTINGSTVFSTIMCSQARFATFQENPSLAYFVYAQLTMVRRLSAHMGHACYDTRCRHNYERERYLLHHTNTGGLF